MKATTRQAVKIAVLAGVVCGGLVLGIAASTGTDEDGLRILIGWLCAVGGAWMLVKVWRDPAGGGHGRHSSGRDPARGEIGLLVTLVACLIGGAVGIGAAIVQRDLVMLGWSILGCSAGATLVGIFSDSG